MSSESGAIHVIFKYDGKAWRRITLQELPAESKTPNLVIASPDDAAKEASHGVVSAEKVKELNTGFRQSEFQTILREPLPKEHIEQMCMEEVRTGDGWMSLDWFSRQKTYGACLKVCEREKVSSQNCPCSKLFKGEK